MDCYQCSSITCWIHCQLPCYFTIVADDNSLNTQVPTHSKLQEQVRFSSSTCNTVQCLVVARSHQAGPCTTAIGLSDAGVGNLCEGIGLLS